MQNESWFFLFINHRDLKNSFSLPIIYTEAKLKKRPFPLLKVCKNEIFISTSYFLSEKKNLESETKMTPKISTKISFTSLITRANKQKKNKFCCHYKKNKEEEEKSGRGNCFLQFINKIHKKSLFFWFCLNKILFFLE